MICSSLFQEDQCTTSDDNSLSAAAKTVTKLKSTLQSESEVIINWFKNNKMIVNPEKFQVIILDKQAWLFKWDYQIR